MSVCLTTPNCTQHDISSSIYLCVYVPVCVYVEGTPVCHSGRGEAKGHLTGVSSPLLPLSGTRGSNSCFLDWWQALSSTCHFASPVLNIFRSLQAALHSSPHFTFLSASCGWYFLFPGFDYSHSSEWRRHLKVVLVYVSIEISDID